jgi:hypothetical protein
MPPATFHEALAQGDRRWIEARLASERPGPEALSELFAADDAGVVYAALEHLTRRLLRLEGDDSASRLLDALPAALGARTAEIDVLLAEAAALLPADLPASRLALALARSTMEPAEVAVAWLRVEALRDPAAFAARPVDERVRHAAASATIERAIDVEATLRALCASTDETVQRAGVTHVEAAARGALAPLPALVGLLIAATGSPHRRVVLAAVTLLGRPWTATPGLPGALLRLRALLGGDDEAIALAALAAVASRGEVGLLRRTLEDPARPPSQRREAMTLLAPFAGHDELRAALDFAAEDPLFHGAACASLLQVLYRRGVRCDPDDVPRVCGLYAQNHDVDTAIVAEVLSQRAPEVAAAVRALPLADPTLPRLVALLGALDAPASTGLLRDLVADPAAGDLAAEVITALARIDPAGPDASAVEADILRRFDALPWSALRALRRIGGDATLRFLRSNPAIGGDAEEAWSPAARDLLFELEEDPARVFQGSGDREPTRATLACIHPALDARGCEALARIAREAAHPLRAQAIAQLGRAATVRAVPALGALLVDAEDDVRSDAQSALRALGSALFERGRIRPSCLIDARSEAKAGELLLADALLQELARPGRSDAQLTRLLEQLVGVDHDHPTAPRRVRRLLRHGNVAVEKLALECLARGSDPRAIAWIFPFAAAEDIYRLRQALTGLGSFGVDWATPALLAGIEHPNMNVKKTAADALLRAGAPWSSVLTAVVRWLGGHDNPGLRETLTEVLVKHGNAATLVDALEKATRDRERELLLEALSGMLSPAAVASAVRRRAPFSKRLLEALYGGEIVLAGGTLRDLDAELRRAGVAGETPTSHLDRAQAKRLRTHRLDEDLDRLEDLLANASTAAVASADEELARLLGELAPMGLSTSRAALLTRHVDAIGGLIDHAAAGVRGAATAALIALAPHLGAPQRVATLVRVRRGLAAGRLAPEQAITLIVRFGGVASVAEARLAFALERAELRRWGVDRVSLAGALDDDEVLRLLIAPGSPGDLRATLIAHARRAGQGDRVIDAALAGVDAGLVVALSESVDAGASDPALLDRLALAAQRAERGILAPLVAWIARVGGDASRAVLRELASSRRAELSDLAIRRLGRPISDGECALLVELLTHERRETRGLAARALAGRSEPTTRAALVALYLGADVTTTQGPGARTVVPALPGGVGPAAEAFTIPIELGLADVVAIEASLASSNEVTRERLLDLLQGSPRLPNVAAARVRALLQIWELDGDASAPRARALLRRLPTYQLLPFLRPKLREGNTAALDVLGPSRRISPELLALFRDAKEHGRRQFLDLIRRWSSASADRLEAPGLADALLASMDAGHPDRGAAIAILPCLAEWGRPDDGVRLGEALLTRVNQGGDEAAFAILEIGAALLPAEARVALLGQVKSVGFFDRVLAIVVPAIVEDASLEKALTPLLRARVGGAIDALAWTKHDIAALSAVARRPSPDLADRLAELLTDPAPKVRLHAQRLLRPLVSRSRYLELTCRLLDDANPGIAVRAIRQVSFGGHAAACVDLAALLYDRRSVVAKAAREGLLVLGAAVTPLLRAEISKARPDRRARIAEVIEAILAREGDDQSPSSSAE